MIDNLLPKLQEFFSFSPKSTIFFTEVSFWIFFTVVYGIFAIVHKKYTLRTLFLLVVSIFFYFKTSGMFFLLMLFSITNDFFVAKAIHKSENARKRKLLIIYSVVLNLGLLSFFKYAYFFTDSYNQIFHTDNKVFNYFAHWSNTAFGTHFDIDKILMPVGISFYTFQILSYTVDVYRKKLTPLNSFFDFAFYASFFPQVLSGPIVKARDFIPQINKPFTLNKYQFGLAIFMILNGLIKKLVVGDYIADNFINRVYGNPLLFSGVENLLAVIAYSMQVYLDFSGYTDIAIGLALLMGFKLKMNFNSPYKAKNTSDFWKRWHISLSSWLQEYLYIPLGGNREGTIGSYIAILILSIVLVMLTGKIWLLLVLFGLAIAFALISYFSASFRKSINTNINLMVTMLLGGLWHGSSWLFIIWGGLNGLGLVIHKLWQKVSPFKNSNTFAVKAFCVIITLLFISFTRIFFRSDSMDIVVMLFDRLWNHFGWELTLKIMMGYSGVLSLILIGYLIHWIPSVYKEKYRNWFAELPYYFMGLIAIIVVFGLYQLMSDEMQPFIYFQF